MLGGPQEIRVREDLAGFAKLKPELRAVGRHPVESGH